MYSIESPVPTFPLSFVFPSELRAYVKIFPDLVSNIPLSDKVSVFPVPRFIVSVANVPPESTMFPPTPLIAVFTLPDPVISISLFILLLFNSPIPTTEPFPVRRISKSENSPLNSPSNISLSLPNAKVDFDSVLVSSDIPSITIFLINPDT